MDPHHICLYNFVQLNNEFFSEILITFSPNLDKKIDHRNLTLDWNHKGRYIPDTKIFGELTNFGDLTILTNHFKQPFLV
jgi:hypothetical protein